MMTPERELELINALAKDITDETNAERLDAELDALEEEMLVAEFLANPRNFGGDIEV